MKKSLLSFGLMAVVSTMLASNGATRADAYSINDVVGTYAGTLWYEDEDDFIENHINVTIEKGTGENSLIINNLFQPLFDFSVEATFNPENNTIQVYPQWLTESEEYILYFTDYDGEYYDFDEFIVLDIEDGAISSGGDWFDLCYYPDPDDDYNYVDFWYYGLDLERTGDLQPGNGYDINAILGTYTVAAVDWDEETDEYTDVIIPDVTIELGDVDDENALVIKNLLAPITNGTIKGTFDPTNNTIVIEEQWVDSNYYIYLYDPEDWLDEIYLTVNEDGSISSGDFAINAYAYYKPELPELYRGEMLFTSGSNAIKNLRPEVEDGREEIYNLQGARVSKDRLTRGLYIINGKKVMVK